LFFHSSLSPRPRAAIVGRSVCPFVSTESPQGNNSSSPCFGSTLVSHPLEMPDRGRIEGVCFFLFLVLVCGVWLFVRFVFFFSQCFVWFVFFFSQCFVRFVFFFSQCFVRFVFFFSQCFVRFLAFGFFVVCFEFLTLDFILLLMLWGNGCFAL